MTPTAESTNRLGRGSAEMNDQLEMIRDVATHDVEIRHLQDDMDKMIKQMVEIKTSIEAIEQTLSEAKGGWKTFLAIGGAGAVVVEVVQWAAHHIGK